MPPVANHSIFLQQLIAWRRHWLVVLCVAYFIVTYCIAVMAYVCGYFDVYDVFFDTDPQLNLLAFTQIGERHALTHALVELLALPISGLAWLLSSSGIVENNRLLRELIALAVSPLFSSLSLVVFYKTLQLLGITRVNTVLFTLIYALCFSNVLFAVVPESYSISGFLIALLCYYYVRCGRLGVYGARRLWLLLAILLSGVTITNGIIFMLVFGLHLYRHRELAVMRAAASTVLYTVFALTTVVIYFYLSEWLFAWESGIDGSVAWVKLFVRTSVYEIIGNSANFLSASVNAFAAISTRVTDNVLCDSLVCNSLSFRRNEADVVWLALAFLGFAGFVWASAKPLGQARWRDLYCLSLAIIAFNIMLHAVFGRDIFMYTQHWLVPLCLLLVPLLHAKPLFSGGLIILLLWFNLRFLLHVNEWLNSTVVAA